MDQKLKQILEKKTGYRDVASLEGSKVSEEYLRYLTYIGLPKKAEAVKGCKENFVGFRCVGGGRHVSYGWQYCGESKACINEDLVENAWEMNDMLVYLQFLFERAKREPLVWFVDLTVAGDIRKRIPRDNLAEFAGLSYQVMQEHFNKKFRFECDFGMEVVPQYWSSTEPGKGFVPHLHTIIPRVFFDRKTGDVSPIRMELLASYQELEELKAMWRQKVESVYGKSRAKVQGKYEKFDVKVAHVVRASTYSVHRRRWNYRRSMRHRLKYMYRGIVFDIEKALVGDYLKGRPPQDFTKWDNEFVRWALITSHKRHVGYGLLSPKGRSAKSPHMVHIGLDVGTRKERLKRYRHKACPDCGCERELDWNVPVLSKSEALEKKVKAVYKRYDEDALSKLDREYLRDYSTPG
ncbi:MAG TPA: hypothetical protein VEC02_03565 [Nitrososphaerales archaeon]|nr:hypothetical protein [Nitrososphaerales archaeon]